jgi:hypothetical protein
MARIALCTERLGQQGRLASAKKAGAAGIDGRWDCIIGISKPTSGMSYKVEPAGGCADCLTSLLAAIQLYVTQVAKIGVDGCKPMDQIHLTRSSWKCIAATALIAIFAVHDATSAEPSTLKDAYKHDFLIGVALGGTLPDDYTRKLHEAWLDSPKRKHLGVCPGRCTGEVRRGQPHAGVRTQPAVA